jgi:hypothetical protein
MKSHIGAIMTLSSGTICWLHLYETES